MGICPDYLDRVVVVCDMADIKKDFLFDMKFVSGVNPSDTVGLRFEKYLKTTTNLRDRSITLYVSTLNDYINSNFKHNIYGINQYLAVKAKEKRNYYAPYMFRHFLGMIDKGNLYKHIIKHMQKPRKRIRPILDLEVVQRLINNIENKDFRMIAKIQYETACRVSEVINLKYEQVNYEGSEARIEFITKGGYMNVKFLRKETTEELIKYSKGRKIGYVFRNDGALNKTVYNKYLMEINRVFSEAGAKHYGTHGFRANIATILLNKGTPLIHVKLFLGHKRIETTARYYEESGIENQKTRELLFKT